MFLVLVVLVLFVGVSTDPEKINHMPVCWNLAGNQREPSGKSAGI